MRKFLTVGLIAGFMLSLAGSSWGGTVLDEIIKKGEIVVSTDANYAPRVSSMTRVNSKGLISVWPRRWEND